jgi:hypothetical protein
MGVLGLINSEYIASSTGIPLGSKVCAASLMISECWRLRPVVSKSKTTYKTLYRSTVGVFSTTGASKGGCWLLRCFLNSIRLDDLFPRCFSLCSSRASWAVATVMAFATTTTTLAFHDGSFTFSSWCFVWRWHGDGDIDVEVVRVSTKNCVGAVRQDRTTQQKTMTTRCLFRTKF